MNALAYLDTHPKKISNRNNAIAEVVAQLEELEQEAKKITEETTKFWGSIIQDE